MTTIETATVNSPIGELALFARGDALCSLVFADHADEMRAILTARFGEVRWLPARDPAGAASRLRRYFDGELGALDGIAVDTGGTPFQQRVWAALRAIPVGQTISYGDLARAIGHPSAVRAVGAANKRNPVSLVIPCHRVVASDGRLHGYAGGLGRKDWLLRHERALLV
jgi:methylated-DNA-[protein]-cysteine S-methyltransferase